MYTATITEKKFEQGILSVTVLYKNETDEFTETLISDNGTTPTWLKDRISAKIKQLELLSQYADTIKTGDFPIEETEKDLFIQKFGKLDRLIYWSRLGIIDANDQQISLLKSELKSQYNPTFLSL